MSSRRVYPMARDAVERERTKHDLEYCTYFSGGREKKNQIRKVGLQGRRKAHAETKTIQAGDFRVGSVMGEA